MNDKPDEPGFVDLSIVKPIELDDAKGHWIFQPRADITAYEVILLNQLFVAQLLRRRRLDWREYLTRDAMLDLPRHFIRDDYA